jgi:hypothetical protein
VVPGAISSVDGFVCGQAAEETEWTTGWHSSPIPALTKTFQNQVVGEIQRKRLAIIAIIG